MKGFGKYLIWLSLALAMSACSTQKNTWASRSYHQTKVKYNIYFNGNTAYETGLKAIRDAHTDDFSQVIPLYPVSDHRAAEAAASSMETTIEKCRKCIKLHSIKAKPKPDAKKSKDPKYRAWLKQEEFNNQMSKAWIRLGEAEFHKGDFLGAVSTFNYVQKHYDYDKDVVAVCQLWVARAYAELDWLYEAEDMLKRVHIDDLSRRHESLYASASADVLLKTGHLHEAIPFVQTALPEEKRNVYRPRFYYALAQLYELEGRRDEAYNCYKRAIRLTPGADMEFHARLKTAELKGNLRSLEKMGKLYKNRDKQDQIYGTMGNICLQRKDTAEALRYYQLAIDSAHTMGPDKAAVLLRAGDLYFDHQQYRQAQPCYSELTTLMSVDNADYARISARSQNLEQLISDYTTIELQDSLQRLSHMTEAEQRAVVDTIIARLVREEEAAAEAAEQAARAAKNGTGLQSVNTANMIGGVAQSADWYYYNPQLIRNGKQEFVKKWGNRSLEDNWRRLSKSVSTGGLESMGTDDEEEQTDADSIDQSGDSTLAAAPVTDVHQPEYYLQQIPKTERDYHISDSLAADAMYDLIYVYADNLADSVMAYRTYQDFAHRYPQDNRLVDLYYMYYLKALKQGDTAGAEPYRQRILSEFPDSRQAQIVGDPNYFERLRRMSQEQDSLYTNTYEAYKAGQFETVKQNKTYAEEQFPLSPLMPRFLFLDAIAAARTESQAAFVDRLRTIVSRYPENELGAMSKSMLAMMGEGMESQKGGAVSQLADLREQIATEEENTDSIAEAGFSRERAGNSYMVLYLAQPDEELLRQMLYEVALFNFSQFMIKDFDLTMLPIWLKGSALRIAGFDSLDETAWYRGLVEQNAELSAKIREWNAEVIQITEENCKLVEKKGTLEEYRTFLGQ